MAVTLSEAEKHLKFAWRQSNRRDVESYWGGTPFGGKIETLDADWWEPTSRWRRENVEERDYYGGEIFAKPSPPVEGPNNPNRLRRELENAEADLERANYAMDEAIDDVRSADERISRLRTKLADR